MSKNRNIPGKGKQNRKGKTSGGGKSQEHESKGSFDKFYRSAPPKEEAPSKKRPESKGRKSRGNLGGKGPKERANEAAPLTGPIRLNRYVALSGLCARREADKLIEAGRIKVNGKKVENMGMKVTPGKDKVQFGSKVLVLRNFVYILLNKPKNYITTVKDDLGRKTVMEIVGKVTKERVFPVGRLDRNTTGLILFTNDGIIAKKLTHPSHEIKKLYHIKLERDVLPDDLDKLKQGIELEDGLIKVDKVSYVENRPFNEIGIELHSGRNRIVRRMMEHLGYEVKGLDRVTFGPLTKRLLPRGKCRILTDKEIGYLNMM